MYNIPLTLFLGKTLSEYSQNFLDRKSLLEMVNREYPIQRLRGHKSTCPLTETETETEPSLLGYHGSYQRKCIWDTKGQCHQVPIGRVGCPKCRQTWSVYPSILVPRKHYDAYVVQNTLEQVLSNELTYRACVRQNDQLCSTGQPQAGQFKSPYTPYHWVQWLGHFPLPLVLLASGLVPPDYVVEDEKFVHQNGHETYILGLVDHQDDVIWWLDYLPATDQTAIQSSLQKFLDELWLAGNLPQPHTFKGATTDGWQAAKNAFKALDLATTVAECLLHPWLKFKQTLYVWAKKTLAAAASVQKLGQLFHAVLFAADPTSFEAGLSHLEGLTEFAHPLLAPRLASLRRKQSGLQAHFEESGVALTSQVIDRRFQRLERKVSSMQQFRSHPTAFYTLNAWSIIQNLRCYGRAAKCAGQSAVEVAGVDRAGLPWLQFIMLKVARLHWLTDPNPTFEPLAQS